MRPTQKSSQNGFSTKKDDISFRVLVIDSSGLVERRIQEDIKAGRLVDNLTLVSTHNTSDVIRYLRNADIDILIGVNLDPQEWYVTLELAKEISAHTVRILLSHNWTEASFREAVNRVHVFRALKADISSEELRMHLHLAAVEASLSRSQLNLTKEARAQNRELEALNQKLEKTVEERTLHIQESKAEMDARLNQVRQIIRLIKDLSQNISFEELMSLVRKDFRNFPKLGDPLLVLRLQEDRYEVMTYRGSHFSKSSVTQITENWEFPKEISINAKSIGQRLANTFGRPFVQVIAIPLDVRLIKKFGLPKAEALLCVESSMGEKEQAQFVDHVLQILKPLSMAVDRLFLENELSIRTSRWEKTFDGLPDPIAIIDIEYNVLRANNKFSDRLLQKKCYQVFAGNSSPCQGCPLEKSISSGGATSGQITVNGKYFEVSSYPIKIESGSKVTTVVNQYVNITESKLLYGKMIQNEKMSAIGLLAGNIAHELNNPLSGIRSMTQILLSEVKSSQVLSDLKEIEKASARSQLIIKNLLDFSTGSLQKTELLTIDEIVEKTMPMLKALIRSYRNEITLNAKNFLIEVDPQLLQQVVFNLINNACQAMGEKGQLSIISEELNQGSKKFVLLKIKDTGPGISPDMQEKIFEPFYTTKAEGHGTGLGLSLSRDIVKKFGGSILVNSKLGAGAEFVIQLPAKK